MAESLWSQDPDLEQKVFDLRDNEGFSWEDVAAVLGFPTPDAPRIRYSRLKARGKKAPRRGRFAYDLALSTTERAEPSTPRKAPAAPPALTFETEARFAKHDYKFDGLMYSFPVAGTIVDIPKDVWEQIVAEYSGEGGDLTMAEIAMRHGMHKKVLEACFKLYGHYKARPPVTREELKSAADAGNLTPLYDRAIEVAEAHFIPELRERKLKFLSTRVRELQNQLADKETERETVRSMLLEVADIMPRESEVPKEYFRRRDAESVVYHMPLFDLHFGLRVDGRLQAWGKEYNTETAAAYVVASAQALVLEIVKRGDTDKDVTTHLSLGGDIFHAFMQQTKKGTLLERDREDRLVWRAAVKAVLDAINILRTVSTQVVVHVIPGNHDHIFAELFADTLALRFDGVDDVEVDDRIGKRTAFLVGETLHVLDHGEGFVRLGAKELLTAETLARMEGREEFFQARHIVLYVGHTHHRESKAQGSHLEVIRVPTQAHTSDFEERLGHGGTPQALFVRLDAKGRIAGEERLYLDDLVPATVARAA